MKNLQLNNQTIIVQDNQKLPSEIEVNSGEFKQIIFVDFLNDTNPLTINFKIKKQANLEVYFFILASSKNKKINLTLEQESSSKVLCSTKIFSLDNSNVSFAIESIIKKDVSDAVVDQLIDGILFDQSSNIKALPCLIVDSNKIKAFHSVNIGSLDPEKIFYLMARGLDKKTAISTIINSHYTMVKSNDKPENISLYNEMQEKILIALERMLG